MLRVISSGRLLFALAIIALGIENLLIAQSTLPMHPVLPWMPPYPLAGYIAGLVLLGFGGCLAANVQVQRAAPILGDFLIGCMVVFHLRKVFGAPMDIGLRTIIFESLAIAAGAFVLSGDKRFTKPGRYLFAVSMIVFGLDHFPILNFIAKLVPDWIPGAMLWAVATGAGMIAAGLAVIINRFARLANFWLGIMFAGMFLTLHLPRVLGLSKAAPDGLHNPDEWSSAFIALAACAASWIVTAASEDEPEKRMASAAV